MLNGKPLNLNVYVPVCFICNHRYLSQYEQMGRRICKDCLTLGPMAFREGIAKGVERQNEMKHKKD